MNMHMNEHMRSYELFLDEELEVFMKNIVEEKDIQCLIEKISTSLDVWPFKDYPLKHWKDVCNILVEIVCSLEVKYFCDGIQQCEICDEDRSVLIMIFRFLQRIVGYSTRRHSVDISSQVMKFIYSLDLEIVIEAYKVLVFSLHCSVGLDEFPGDHDILFRCMELDPKELSSTKTLNIPDEFFVPIPDEVGEVFDFMRNEWKKYGRGHLVVELRRRMYSGDVDGLNVLKVVGTCVFLMLIREGGIHDEISNKIDISWIQGLMNSGGDDVSRNMEFGIMSLIDVLINNEFDFLRISRILQLDDSNGFFYRRFHHVFDEYEFERCMVFVVYHSIASNQKSKYLKVDLMMKRLECFTECSPDVRYHFLRVMRIHSRETNAKGISEFIANDGMRIILEYLERLERYDFNETINIKYAFKVMSEMYMRDGRNALGIGNFEDSKFLDVIISTVRNCHMLDTRLISACVITLACFMFDEPLNFNVFIEKGVDVVLDTLESVDMTLEYISAFISFIDAFSLNLEFQRRVIDGEYLVRLLLYCREDEFLGSSSGSRRMFSLLNVLVMHHPEFKKNMLQFYEFEVIYLRNVFMIEIEDSFVVDEYHMSLFDNLFGLIERMELYHSGDDAKRFFDEISELVINREYSFSMQNLIRGSFGEVYRNVHKRLVRKKRPFKNLIRSTRRLIKKMDLKEEGYVIGYPWKDDEEVNGRLERLIFSYDTQISLISMICDEGVECDEEVVIELFDVMSELFFTLICLSSISLPVSDMNDFRFSSSYRLIRMKIKEDSSRNSIRMCVLQSIYLSNQFILQRLYPILLNIDFDLSVEFTHILVFVSSFHDCTVVGLRFLERLNRYFEDEHHELLIDERFMKALVTPGGGDTRFRAVVDFFTSCMMFKLNCDDKLRYEFLRYLNESRIDIVSSSGIELSNIVIEAIRKIFENPNLSPSISVNEMDMIVDVYERFYVSPLCERLIVRRIVRSSRYTIRLIGIKAFGSFQHFLMRDKKVYSHSCFIVNKFFECSDEFIEMASHVLLFASIGMCPHMVDIQGIKNRIPDLLDSDVSFEKILFFLMMYFRLLDFMNMEMMGIIELGRIIGRVTTNDDLMKIRVILSYMIPLDMKSILADVIVPSSHSMDEQFIKEHDFLIYRNYELVMGKYLFRSSDQFKNRSSCFSRSGDRRNEDGGMIVKELAGLLERDEYFESSAQILSGMLLNDTGLDDVSDSGVLEMIYERYIKKLDVGYELVGKNHWAVTLITNALHSEILSFVKKNEEMVKKIDMMNMLKECAVTRFIIEKINSTSNDDFLRASFMLVRSLTPLFILRHEIEEDDTIARFKEISNFLGSIGIIEVMMKRICMVEENDLKYEECIQYSLDYLCKIFKHCYGETTQDFDGYGDDGSREMDYYDDGSEDVERSEFDSEGEGSYFDDSPFHDTSDDSIIVESDSIDSSDDVVMIKSIDNDYEIPTMGYIIHSEYRMFEVETRMEVENMLCKRFCCDILKNEDDVDCGLTNGRVDAMNVRVDDYERCIDDGDGGDDDRGVWGLKNDEEMSEEDVEYGDESESEESSVGSLNGEEPDLEPEVLNEMNVDELRGCLREYFDRRRSVSLTYRPLNVRFYERLSPDVKSMFEEMERMYREDFFYDMKSESIGDDEEHHDTKESRLLIDHEVFRGFVRKSIVERGFLFAKSWKLIDILSKDAEMGRIIFNISSCTIRSIVIDDGEILDDIQFMMFKRSVCLMLSIIRNGSGYHDYFREDVDLIDDIFNIFEKARFSNDVFRLMTDLSVIFKMDKECVIGKNVRIEKICDCFRRMVDSECFNLLEEFVENTANHFHSRFIDVISSELETRFESLMRNVVVLSCSNDSLSDQKVFLRLWKMLSRVCEKNIPRLNDAIIGLMQHEFWNVFFECQKEKRSVEDLMNVCDVFEAFFIVGKIFESGIEGAELADSFRRISDEFVRFYKRMIESQTLQINILVEEQPERLFKNFSGLVDHWILTFGNKRKYLSRRLRVEGVDKSSSFYGVYVDRNDVLRSSYFQVMAKSAEEFRTKRLEIKLSGEEGLDYGGLTREWLGLLTKDLLDPNIVLFESCTEENTSVVPCRNSYVNPEHLSYFKFVGRIMAKAIMDGNFMNLHLSTFIYKYLLGRNCDLSDLSTADPEFYKSLIWIRDNPVDESLRLTFSFDDMSFGGHRTIDLIENGSDIFVTDCNKIEYIRLATEYRLFNGIELQLSALKSGLIEIIGDGMLSMFDENELELLICGVPDINVDDWKSNTMYYGYTEGSKTITWFWKAVKGFDAVDRAKLLQFVTGTSTLPFEGFSHLQGNNEIQKFSIHKVSDRLDSLPTAHTCFNQLVLPEYSSYDNLLKYLLLAINECSTGFGFI